MTDVVTQTTSDSSSNNVTPNQPQATTAPVESISREEKLRRAKIAMEGMDRTIRREASEKQEEASEEKQNLNRLILSLNHEKELLELTWVNLDDKRTNFKKILEPIITQEEMIEAEENEVESKEGVAVNPKDRRELEKSRWAIQDKRKKIEEEKWLVEEKIEKIDQQILEIKDKYQKLLNQEEELRQKIQSLDEQLILQQEVLRQQHDLEEKKRQQEALRQMEQTRQREEASRAEQEAKQKELEAEAKKTPTQAEMPSPRVNPKISIDEKIATLRRAEEERQRLNSAPAPTPTPQASPAETELAKKQAALQRALELERVRRENEEVEESVQTQKNSPAKNQSLIDSLKQDDSDFVKPLRTLQSDLASINKNQGPDAQERGQASKIFPWLKP